MAIIRTKTHRLSSLISALIGALACLGIAVGAPAVAQFGDGARGSLQADATFREVRFGSIPFQSAGMSLEQAVAMVQSRYSARALKFNTVEEEGKRVHYIRLITADKSRVWTVRVDAATGREF